MGSRHWPSCGKVEFQLLSPPHMHWPCLPKDRITSTRNPKSFYVIRFFHQICCVHPIPILCANQPIPESSFVL